MGGGKGKGDRHRPCLLPTKTNHCWPPILLYESTAKACCKTTAPSLPAFFGPTELREKGYLECDHPDCIVREEKIKKLQEMVSVNFTHSLGREIHNVVCGSDVVRALLSPPPLIPTSGNERLVFGVSVKTGSCQVFLAGLTPSLVLLLGEKNVHPWSLHFVPQAENVDFV